MTRVSVLAATAVLLLAAPSTALGRPKQSVDFRVVDLGSVLDFDVDLCTSAATRVRFEADFRRAGSGFTYRRWRGERQGGECTRLFLGLRQTPVGLTAGAWRARLRVRFLDLHTTTTTHWRRFEVQ